MKTVVQVLAGALGALALSAGAAQAATLACTSPNSVKELAATSSATLTVTCPDGYFVTGGGFVNNEYKKVTLYRSQRASNTTWECEVRNGSLTKSHFTCTATCCKVQ